MDGNSSITFAFLVTLVNLGMAVMTFVRNRSKDERNMIQETKDRTAESIRESDAKELANKEFQIKTQLKLDQICTTTTETRTDIKAMDTRLDEFDRRLFHAECAIESVSGRLQFFESTALGASLDAQSKENH
jgi:hypothetical protein